MRQQEIDELLESSDDQEIQKKRKKDNQKNKNKNKNEDQYAEQYDEFFQSQQQGDQSKPVTLPTKHQQLEQKNSKAKQKQSSKAQKQKQKIQSHDEDIDEENYLNSQDFEQSQISPNIKVTQPQRQINSKNYNNNNKNQSTVKSIKQENDQAYEENFQQQPIQTQRSQEQIQIENNLSQDLVESKYTESRLHQQQNEEIINENYNNDDDIETVKSSTMKSQVIGSDDDMSEVQSQYVDSFRGEEIKKHEFKKDPNKKIKQTTIIDMKKNKLSTKNDDKSKPTGQNNDKINPKLKENSKQNSARTESIVGTAKKISNEKKADDKNKKLIKNSTENLNPKPSLNQTKNKSKAIQQKKQPNEKQEQHKQRIAEIQNEKKILQDKKMAKINKEKQMALKQYEELKKKQEEKRQYNRKILQEREKLKQENKNSTASLKNKAQAEALNLTESKIKEITQQEQKKKEQKAKMRVTQELKMKRKKQQQLVKQKLQNENKQKLLKLQQQKTRYFDKKNNEKQFYEIKKKEALMQRNVMKQNFMAEKKQEIKQKQAPQVRKIKQQITQLKQKIEQKQSSISDLQDKINELKKSLKKKQQIKYSYQEESDLLISKNSGLNSINFGAELLQDNSTEQELTSVQKFVRMFEQCSNPGEIFKLIDQNDDQMISVQEIKQKIISLMIENNKNSSQFYDDNDSSNIQNNKLKLQKSLTGNAQLNSVIEEVYEILDKNSDGSVTKDEFSFIIDSELKKVRQFRKLVKDIPFKTPIEIEASILDMKQKIKYMQKKTNQQLNSSQLAQLQDKYQKYLAKCEDYQKKLTITSHKKNKKEKQSESNIISTTEQTLKHDKIYFLRQEVAKLRLKKQNQQKMLNKIRQKQSQNIKQKNLLLSQKVEENIKLSAQIYKIKLKLEEDQLRFLSKQKIQQNRYRFAAKQSQQKQQYEEAIQRAKQYQAKILNPAKQIKFGNYANQVKYLAAVIMIQRNFRKRKALKQVQNLKAGQ